MTRLQSTAPAAHVWLRSQLATIPLDSTAEVSGSIDVFNRVVTGIELPEDFIVVGKVTSLTQSWAGFGNGRRDEHYDIDCMVRVFRGDPPDGGQVDTLMGIAWGYVEDVVQLISSPTGGDPTLGGNVYYAELAKADENDASSSNAGGLEVAIDFTIAVRAQVEA